MKKVVLSILLFLFIQPICFADKMKAVVLNDFTTRNQNAKIRIYVEEDFYLNNNVLIPEESFLVGQITDIKEPRRLKRNASFKFLAMYFMDAQKNMYKFNTPLIAKQGKRIEIEADEVAESGALFIAGKIIPGVSYVYHGVQGAKKSPGRRFKGAMRNIYEHSFLAWKDKGTHLDIKKYDCFYLIFPNYKETDFDFTTLFTPIDKKGNALVEYDENGAIKQLLPLGADLEINYPSEHLRDGEIRYLSRPDDDEEE